METQLHDKLRLSLNTDIECMINSRKQSYLERDKSYLFVSGIFSTFLPQKLKYLQEAVPLYRRTPEGIFWARGPPEGIQPFLAVSIAVRIFQSTSI